MNRLFEQAPRLGRLLERARGLPALRVAVVGAEEVHVLEGVIQAHQAGLVEPVLVGPRTTIARICREIGCDLGRYEVVEVEAPDDAAAVSVQLVVDGRVEALVKGWIHTDELMHPVLAQLRTGQRVSHVFVTELQTYHKLLYVTDAAINITPDLMTKAAIVQNAVDLARLLGVDRPRVAALSAVEVVKPAIASTLDAACLSKMAQRRQIHHAVVDGPLAFDNAISREAARIKQIDSEVSGEVDVLLVPDLNAGNILAKDLEYLARATMAGIVVGARVPIMLPSRSDPPVARLASAAIAVLMYHHRAAQEDGNPG